MGDWTYTTSPLGYPEIIAPGQIARGNQAIGGETFPNTSLAAENILRLGGPDIKAILGNYNDPTVIYSKDPSQETLNHERIHVGQNLSRYQHSNQYGEPRDLELILRMFENAKALGLSPMSHRPTEVPAYSFSNPNNYNKQDFADYINRIHMAAPFPEGLEAHMPDPEMKNYLKNTPIPYNKKAPKVQMREIKEK